MIILLKGQTQGGRYKVLYLFKKNFISSNVVNNMLIGATQHSLSTNQNVLDILSQRDTRANQQTAADKGKEPCPACGKMCAPGAGMKSHSRVHR